MSKPSHPLLLGLERIEQTAWIDLAQAAPPALAAGIGLRTAEIHHAFFLMASRIRQFQFNWLSGTGLNGDDGGSIAEAVQRFRAAGQHKFIVQIPPGPNAKDCAARAREAGLTDHALAWAKFYRPTASAPTVTTSLTIREVDANERDLFAATAVAGFGMPAPMAAGSHRLSAGHTGTHTSRSPVLNRRARRRFTSMGISPGLASAQRSTKCAGAAGSRP